MKLKATGTPLIRWAEVACAGKFEPGAGGQMTMTPTSVRSGHWRRAALLLATAAGAAAILYPALTTNKKRAKVESDLEMLVRAIQQFHDERGVLPASVDELIDEPRIDLCDTESPRDPWDNPYVYLKFGTSGGFSVTSFGADGIPGGVDENGDVTRTAYTR